MRTWKVFSREVYKLIGFISNWMEMRIVYIKRYICAKYDITEKKERESESCVLFFNQNFIPNWKCTETYRITYVRECMCVWMCVCAPNDDNYSLFVSLFYMKIFWNFDWNRCPKVSIIWIIFFLLTICYAQYNHNNTPEKYPEWDPLTLSV